jgi:hypothetical protein
MKNREDPAKFIIPLVQSCENVNVHPVVLDVFQNLIMYGFVDRLYQKSGEIPIISLLDLKTSSIESLIKRVENRPMRTLLDKQQFMIDMMILTTCHCEIITNISHAAIIRTISVALTYFISIYDWHYSLMFSTIYSILLSPLSDSDQIRNDASDTVVQLFARIFTPIEYPSDDDIDDYQSDQELPMFIIGHYKSKNKFGKSASFHNLTTNLELYLPERISNPILNVIAKSPIGRMRSPTLERRASVDVEPIELRRRSPSTISPTSTPTDKGLLSFFLPRRRTILQGSPMSLSFRITKTRQPCKEFSGTTTTKSGEMPFIFELLPRHLINRRQDEDTCRCNALAVFQKLTNYSSKKLPKESIHYYSNEYKARVMSLQMTHAIISKIGTQNELFISGIADYIFEIILSNLIMMPTIFSLCIELFELVLGKFESIWRRELSAILENAILPILDSTQSTFFQRITILKFLSKLLANVPATEMYKRFATGDDHALVSIFNTLCHVACRPHFEPKWIGISQDMVMRSAAADLALQIVQSVNQSLQMELDRRQNTSIKFKKPIEKISAFEIDPADEILASQMNVQRRKRFLYDREFKLTLQNTRNILSDIRQEKVGSVMATITTDVWDEEELTTYLQDDEDDDLDLVGDMFQQTYLISLQLLDSLFKSDEYFVTCLKFIEMIANTAAKIQHSQAFGSTVSYIAHNTRLLEHVQESQDLSSLSNLPISAQQSSLFSSFSSFFGGAPQSATPIGTSTTSFKPPPIKFNIECAKLMLKLVHTQSHLMTSKSWGDIVQCVSKIEMLPQIYKSEFIVMQASIDTLFVKSVSLNGSEFFTFIKGLCIASRSILHHFGNSNRRYGLDKILEVAYFNMSRSDEDRIAMWHLVGGHLVDALYLLTESPDTAITNWIMDTMRQLAETYLEQNKGECELLPEFARQTLLPFYHVIDRSESNPELRDRIIMNCLGPIVLKRYTVIRSGWKCVLQCIGRIAEFDYSNADAHMVEYLFDEYLSMMMVRNDYFSVITENDSFVDLVDCLSKYASCSQQISGYAIEFIAMCAQNLALGKVPTKNEDDVIRLWKSVCESLCRVVCDAERIEIRHNAMDQILTIIRTHCIGKYDTKFWNEIFGNSLLLAVRNSIERECKSTIIATPSSPTSPVENTDIKRYAALVTEWVGMTLPRMMLGIQNLICDLYQQKMLESDHIFFQLAETIRAFFVHEQKRSASLERSVVFNAKLAEIGSDCLSQLFLRVGTWLSDSQWAIIREHLRDLILVDTNGTSHISRFIYDADVFDVQFKIHKTLLDIVTQLVVSYCGTKKLWIHCMTLEDVQMFLEIVWSSYKCAQELHQELLTAQLHTQRISRQYSRMVQLRPRLIRHETMTIKAYLDMLFRMLHANDLSDTQNAAQELLLPLSRDLIDSYLASSQISSPSTPSDDVRQISRDLIRTSSPVDEEIPSSPHKRTSSQYDIRIDTKIRQNRRKSLEIESPKGSNSTKANTVYMKDHMDMDSKMTNEMVHVIALILNGFLIADRFVFDVFVNSIYDALSDLILSDVRAIREPLRSIFQRRRSKN